MSHWTKMNIAHAVKDSEVVGRVTPQPNGDGSWDLIPIEELPPRLIQNVAEDLVHAVRAVEPSTIYAVYGRCSEESKPQDMEIYNGRKGTIGKVKFFYLYAVDGKIRVEPTKADLNEHHNCQEILADYAKILSNPEE